ncbi:FMN-dependent NADH-azoreductase [Sedimentitalea sp. XS_ASV28]|uniref:FMN-dependent NADH-azoreductase n=1 Tax=Sedimentitalea sp. XS_ASV28 TaxID=3241296 RepID=UPI003517E236
MTGTILHIDASARRQGSVSRDLSASIVEHLRPARTLRRDLSDPLPHITEDWVIANFTPADTRSDRQKEILALSDQLVEEIEAADTIVIGMPMYNFNIPASLKAWIDLIARAGRTFEYTESGPRGLLTGKRTIVAIATGGSPVGSELDFATPYLRHILGFVGLRDIEFIAADRLNADRDAAVAAANARISALAA